MESNEIPSLKLTFSPLKMDGWNTIYFPFGANDLFSGAKWLLVSGSPGTFRVNGTSRPYPTFHGKLGAINRLPGGFLSSNTVIF